MPKSSYTLRRHVIFAIFLITALGGFIGIWAVQAELSSAVIAPGKIVIDENVKKLQHADGGIIAEINVKNGDRVKAGEVMIRLDTTEHQAELAILTAQLTELLARSARLNAEAQGGGEITFPSGYETQSNNARTAAIAERRLLQDARTHQKGREAELELQISQLKEEKTGLKAEQKAKQGQIHLIGLELKQLQQLYKKNLTSVTRLYALQREQKRLEGEEGSLTARLARTAHKISETKLQILTLARERQLEAQRERRAVVARISELKEKASAIAARLKRSAVKAPRAGLVHELAVHTIGGVITPAETIMLIVPDHEKLTIEVKVPPADIDQIKRGQTVRLRFSAFNQSTTPELQGELHHVAADVTIDEKSREAFYKARISIERDTAATLKLIPGMPVEAFILTNNRTALSYFIKPITDQFTRALREE